MTHLATFKEKCKIFNINNSSAKISEIYSKIRINFEDDSFEKRNEILKYAEENFKNNWVWSAPFYAQFIDFWFIDNEDATVFKLKWS